MSKARISIQVLLLALVGILLLGAPGPANAQEPRAGLQMEVEPGFDGFVKYGEWLPVWVTLENSGADINGELRIQVFYGGLNSTYTAPAELPAGGRKRIPVYVLPNNYARQLEVELLEDGQVIASQLVDVNPLPNINYFVGLAVAERGTLPLITSVTFPGQFRDKVIIDLPLDEFPARPEALRSFNLIIINDVDTTSLSTKQVTALQQWVEGGGRLVLGGGAGARRVAAGLAPEMLPVAVDGDTRLETLGNLPALADDLPVLVPGPYLVATGSIFQGKTLAEEQGIPLVQELALGNGFVDFIALDVAASPFDAWNGVTDFWETLLTPGAVYPTYFATDMSPRQQRSGTIYYALTNLPMLDLPSARELAALLGIYVLLVGPVNYLLLRWKKKLHLAWLTIPVITLVFSLGAFGLGYLRRGNDLILNKISVFQLNAQGTAQLSSFVGLFSPNQASFELEVLSEGLLSPVSPYYDPWSSWAGQPVNSTMTFVQSNPSLLRGLAVSQGSMQGFMLEDSIQDFGKLTGDFRLTPSGISGTLRNDTGQDIHGLVVSVGNQIEHLGDLSAGEELEIEIEAVDITTLPFYMSPFSYRVFESELYTQNGQTNRSTEVRRAVLESVFDYSGFKVMGGAQVNFSGASQGIQALVLGWIDEAPPEVRVEGKEASEQVTALVYTTLPVLPAEEGAFSLAPGLISAEMTESSGNVSQCGDMWSSSYYMGRGEATFEYSLPEGMDEAVISALRLGVVSERGWLNALTVNMFDWDTLEWAEYIPVQGVNLIPNPAGYIREDGKVRLQLVGEDDFGNCVNLALGLDANQ